MVKNMKTTLTEKINWTKYNLAYPELGDVIQMIRTGDMQLHDNEFGDYTLKQAIEHIRSVAPGDMRKCTERRDIPASNAFVPAAAGLIVGGEVVKDLIQKAHTMRISPEEAPNNAYAIAAEEKATKHMEKYKELMLRKKAGEDIEDKVVKPLPF